MSLSRFKQVVFVCSIMLCCQLADTRPVLAQRQGEASTTSTTREDIDLEVKLELIVASNSAGEGAKLPPQLDATIRQLRASLPYTHYRWAATFINRVSNGADSTTKGIAGPLLGTTPPTSSVPSFYDLVLTDVTLAPAGSQQKLVHFRMHFGARLPIMAGSSASSSSSSGSQTVNYEGTGISTTLSIPENEPVVVGTMSLGPTNEMLVLVVSVKRIS
ncbi:MAG TPA: hypothetical protein VF735_15505 [Pyrinomonadaceae bacterium]|jgi:hypothetical protein